MSEHEGNEPAGVDVGRLKEEIRQCVAERRQRGESGRYEAEFAEVQGVSLSADLGPLRAAIAEAQRRAEVGREVTPMLQFKGALRQVALAVGKAIVYLASFITDQQRMYNRGVIHSLHVATDLLELMRMQLDDVAMRQSLLEKKQADIMSSFEHHAREVVQTLNYLKAGVGHLERRMGTLTAPAAQGPLTGPHGSGGAPAGGSSYAEYEALYLFFEERFRGSREEIKSRQREYLAVLKAAGAGTTDRPVVDVGCGRGEWLELLAEEHLAARGIDSNAVVVEQCRQMGLDVSEGDGVAYLAGLSGESLGAVTGFHIIEHLQPGSLIGLLDETVRVLRPGGVAIFETPNPLNILVGASNFYIDPTHQRPLHPEFMAFLMESRGFARVERRFLHPFGREYHVDDEASAVAKRFNEYFYGPQDYAVIGYRA